MVSLYVFIFANATHAVLFPLLEFCIIVPLFADHNTATELRRHGVSWYGEPLSNLKALGVTKGLTKVASVLS